MKQDQPVANVQKQTEFVQAIRKGWTWCFDVRTIPQKLKSIEDVQRTRAGLKHRTAYRQRRHLPLLQYLLH